MTLRRYNLPKVKSKDFDPFQLGEVGENLAMFTDTERMGGLDVFFGCLQSDSDAAF